MLRKFGVCNLLVAQSEWRLKILTEYLLLRLRFQCGNTPDMNIKPHVLAAVSLNVCAQFGEAHSLSSSPTNTIVTSVNQAFRG